MIDIAGVDFDTLRIPWQVDHTWLLIRDDGTHVRGPGRSVEEACARLQVNLEEFNDYEDLGPATNNMVAVNPIAWRRWFAWHLVVLDNGNGARVWLRWIQRGRFAWAHDSGSVWLYKL